MHVRVLQLGLSLALFQQWVHTLVQERGGSGFAYRVLCSVSGVFLFMAFIGIIQDMELLWKGSQERFTIMNNLFLSSYRIQLNDCLAK